MNSEIILYGLIGLSIGLIGITMESRKPLKDKKNEGWNYTRSKFVISSWSLLITGGLLVIYGLFNTE